MSAAEGFTLSRIAEACAAVEISDSQFESLSIELLYGWPPTAAPQQHAQAALSDEQIEDAAKAIYPHLPAQQGASPADYPWQDGGNSHMQTLARDMARAALATRQPAPVASAPAVAVPVAYVPVHPRTGEVLWANTIPTLNLPHPSYEMRPLVFAPQPAAAPVAFVPGGLQALVDMTGRPAMYGDAKVLPSAAPVASAVQGGISPDAGHLVALALAGALPDAQAAQVLRDAYANHQPPADTAPEGWQKAIEGLMDFAPTNKGPLPGMIRGGAYVRKADVIAAISAALAQRAASQPELTVWEGAMPESNGKSNFTAVLYRKNANGFDMFTDGFTIARSEYPDRVRYEADCVRHLIGELPDRPDILAYDDQKHSGYVAPAKLANQPDSVPTTVANQAINDALLVGMQDSGRDAALKAARAWIVKNRPAMTLSRKRTVDEYMRLLTTIDAAMAAQQGEKGSAA